MSIVYAKHFPPFAWESLSDDRELPTEVERILFFDPVLERFGNPNVSQRLRTIDPRYRSTNALVIRARNINYCETFKKEIPEIRSIAPSINAIYVLAPNFATQKMQLVRIDEFSGDSHQLLLKRLRQIEIEGIIRRSNALFTDSHGHYLLPSGAHANGFLRLGDALQDQIEVSRFSNWLLPYVSENKVFIGDTGALLALFSTLGLEAQRLLKIYLNFRTLTKYPESTDEIDEILNDVLSRRPNAELIFVVSVNSSGSLIEKILSVAPPQTKIVAIVDTSLSTSTNIEVLSTIRIPTYAVRASGTCEECPNGHPIRIDKSTYERIPYFTNTFVKIDIGLATQHKRFWEEADKEACIKIHYDVQGNDGMVRHHATYIDIAKLLKNEWFRGEARNELLKISAPNLILVPMHGSTESVIELLNEVWSNCKIVKVQPGRFSDEVTEAIKCVPESGSILIADDGLVGGTTLHGLKLELYRVTQELSRTGIKVDAFVCLARPESQSVLTSASRPYRDGIGNHLQYAYKIFLPGTSDANCPWCVEESISLGWPPMRLPGNLS